MEQSIIQVDAFTSIAFSGNPAAVCVLSAPVTDRWMQQVAQEMNLSETAFLLPQADGFQLRWFTPTTEVDLCGHATLASAHVLWSEGHLPIGTPAQFQTRSGRLTATQQGDWIELDFPANPPRPIAPPPGLETALGASIQAISKTSLGYLVEVASEAEVRRLNPDFQQLSQFPVHGVIVTSLAQSVDAQGTPYDFVSRFFAPALGINEDPVTGAAHCCLAPYWSQKLHKPTLLAYQASARGGMVKVRDGGDRVQLAGQAITVLRGVLQMDAGVS